MGCYDLDNWVGICVIKYYNLLSVRPSDSIREPTQRFAMVSVAMQPHSEWVKVLTLAWSISSFPLLEAKVLQREKSV